MKKPTQLDVARLAGVSRTTVSFVVSGNNTNGVQISEETRQRVLDAVDQLGYVVNAGAQSLRSGETRTIGVLLPIYENPFYWQILSGISSEAETSGYSVLLSHNTLTPEQETESIRELAEQRVDGMILLIGFRELSDQVMNQIRKSDRPLVEICAAPSEFDYVHQGYGAGTHALMAHLMELGHQRIGFVYGVSIELQGMDRLQAYREALENAGLPYDEALIRQCGSSIPEGNEAARQLLSQARRPTALLAINDLLGMVAIRAAADLGLRVPDDVSIASFDDIPFSSISVPRLTTIASSPEQNGRAAVRLLLRRLNEPERPREVIVSDWNLVIRESTGPAPQTTSK